MARSYIRATSVAQVFVGCACSKCGNARLMLCAAKVEASERYMIDRDGATKAAQDDTKAAIKLLPAEVYRQAALKHDLTKGFTVYMEKKNGQPVDAAAHVKLEGADAPCPVCGRKEPWQVSPRAANDVTYEDLHEDNWPHAWINGAEASAWLNTYAEARRRELMQHWQQNPELKRSLTEERERLESEKAAIQQEIENLPEKIRLESIREKRNRESERKTGLFSPERKEQNARLKQYNKEIETLEKTIWERSKALQEKADALSPQILQLSLQLVGSEGKIISRGGKNSLSWSNE